MHPRTGFQVESVHSICDVVLIWQSVPRAAWVLDSTHLFSVGKRRPSFLISPRYGLAGAAQRDRIERSEQRIEPRTTFEDVLLSPATR